MNWEGWSLRVLEGGRVSLWSLAIEQNPVYEQVASAR